MSNEKLREFIKTAMSKGLIGAVMAPAPTKTSYTHALITSKRDVGKLVPIAPVMQWNGADMLRRITRLGDAPRKTLAILRPCEARTFKELVKFNQIKPDNIIVLVYDCPGTVHVRDYAKKKIELETLLDEMQSGKISDSVREACKICEYPVPVENVGDVGYGLFGTDDPVFFPLSEKGSEFLSALGITPGERDAEKWVRIHRENRAKWLENERITGGRKGIEDFLSSCLNCHNCKNMCPICFCKECFFEDRTIFEYNPDKYYDWADDKEGIRLPTDKVLFHLGRLVHMGTSCIGCGLCQQACPVDIPLYRLFGIVAHDLQKVFNYTPGITDDPPPVMDFREDELHEFEGLREGGE